ncbi:Enoyl-CoA hydratase/carnithine racemase [Collimonas sp. OK607]|uniref:enoyl-CoA hydratase/isomerase family protein n=1 Tax=Collimonas sp. OK607 TaxID=1798194 RepID=UPI0008E09C6B|nr:enoyl-CoA hydratase/isomerase family protein [Collimonas sp. OK607]SFB35513.1 Enoyl-CoA hydratase/carnithine racemase [Collimonas sp. OK607]
MNDANSQPVLFDTLTADNGSRIGIVTLNAEKTLNALSLEMIDLLAAQLTAWSSDVGIAVVVLQAAGEKAFCAGGDLQNLYQSMLAHHASDEKDDIRANRYAGDFFAREYRLDYLIHTYPKPILCWGHGIVMGGGIGLMAGASHRVVTEKSRLAMPEIGIGLFPDVGGTWFLNRMPGKLGLFLALTGAMINASDAKFTKLADYAIAQADKQTVLDALLRQPWNASQSENNELLGAVLRMTERSLELPSGPLRNHFDVINTLCSKESLAQIVAAITALETDDAWLNKAAASLAAGSPGSVHLAYLLLQRAPHLSLADVLRMEYVAALHCAAHPDFAEGIRALLIDKDQRPHWQPASLGEVRSDWMAEFIVSPWSADAHPLANLGN